MNEKQDGIFLFYTPFCATCQLAEKMLEILHKTKEKGVQIYKCHVSHFQDFVHQWKIESVPCLIFIKEGVLVKKVYAIESVSKLYSLYNLIY